MIFVVINEPAWPVRIYQIELNPPNELLPLKIKELIEDGRLLPPLLSKLHAGENDLRVVIGDNTVL